MGMFGIYLWSQITKCDLGFTKFNYIFHRKIFTLFILCTHQPSFQLVRFSMSYTNVMTNGIRLVRCKCINTISLSLTIAICRPYLDSQVCQRNKSRTPSASEWFLVATPHTLGSCVRA